MARTVSLAFALCLAACANTTTSYGPGEGTVGEDPLATPSDAPSECAWDQGPGYVMSHLGKREFVAAEQVDKATWLLLDDGVDPLAAIPVQQFGVALVGTMGEVARQSRAVVRVPEHLGPWRAVGMRRDGDEVAVLVASPTRCALTVLDYYLGVRLQRTLDDHAMCAGLHREAAGWSLHGQRVRGGQRVLERVTVTTAGVARAVPLTRLREGDTVEATFLGAQSGLIARSGADDRVTVSLFDAEGAMTSTHAVPTLRASPASTLRLLATRAGLTALAWSSTRRSVHVESAPLAAEAAPRGPTVTRDVVEEDGNGAEVEAVAEGVAITFVTPGGYRLLALEPRTLATRFDRTRGRTAEFRSPRGDVFLEFFDAPRLLPVSGGFALPSRSTFNRHGWISLVRCR